MVSRNRVGCRTFEGSDSRRCFFFAVTKMTAGVVDRYRLVLPHPRWCQAWRPFRPRLRLRRMLCQGYLLAPSHPSSLLAPKSFSQMSVRDMCTLSCPCGILHDMVSPRTTSSTMGERLTFTNGVSFVALILGQRGYSSSMNAVPYLDSSVAACITS